MKDGFRIALQKMTNDPDRGVSQAAKDTLKLF